MQHVGTSAGDASDVRRQPLFDLAHLVRQRVAVVAVGQGVWSYRNKAR
jgi:hypothetical protein